MFAGFILGGCERITDAAGKFANGAKPTPTKGEPPSLAPEIRIASASKPEIMTAFEEIALALEAHNAEFIRRFEAGQPGNGPAYSAGILKLHNAGRRHTGLTKQIIDAVSVTLVFEKGLFVVFDTMDQHFAAVTTRGGSVANQRRAYIGIIDSGIGAYDKAIRYLESGEAAQLRYNFGEKKVPSEIAEEFLRQKAVHGEAISKIEKEMFVEGRAALQSYRSAYSQTDAAKADAHLAEGKRHESRSEQLLGQMVSEIRKQQAGYHSL
jgi:hypothetical protein